MVQVLPGVPTFAQQLLPQINQSLSQILQGHQQGVTKRQDQDIFNQFQDPNKSLLERVGLLGKLSPGARKEFAPIAETYIKEEGRIGEARQKSQQAQQEKDQENDGIRKSFDFLKQKTGEVSRGGYTPVKTVKSLIPSSQYNEVASEYDSTGFLVADKIFTHFNKGTISKDKLKKIENLAPNSKNSDSENLGRIKALESMLNLPPDTSTEKFNKELAKAEKQIKNSNESQERPPIGAFYG